MVESYELDLVEKYWSVIQFLKFVVHEGGYDIQLMPCLGVCYCLAPFTGQITKRASHLDPMVLPVVLAENRYLFLVHYSMGLSLQIYLNYGFSRIFIQD